MSQASNSKKLFFWIESCREANTGCTQKPVQENISWNLRAEYSSQNPQLYKLPVALPVAYLLSWVA